MPPGPPHQPSLAAKWWLFRRESEADQEHSHAPGRSMSIESLEHMVRSRVRMFLRHTWLVAIFGTLVIIGTVTGGIYFWSQVERMRIAAGPLEIPFVRALSNQLTTQRRDLRLQIVETTGAEASAEAMSKNQADFAVLPGYLDDSLNWPVVGIIRQNVMALIVPAPPAAPPAAAKPKAAETAAPAEKPSAKPASKKAKTAKGSKAAKPTKTAKNAKASDKSDDGDDSDDDDSGKSAKADKGSDKDDSNKLEKVSQLAGKRVGIVTGNEATRGLLEILLGHYGAPIAKVTVLDIKPENVADAVKNNQVDVLFVAGAAAGRAISNTVAAATRDGTAPSFIAIDQADGIAKRHPAFDSIDIDAGTFGGNPPTPDDDLKSLSFAEYLVARKTFHESLVATLAKTLYSSRQSLAIAVPGDVKVEAPSTDKDAAVVLHPGALAYLSDSQQSFFDKYGDDIFYGMLIFPVFGSAIAGVASYLLRDTRTRRLRLLQRVLDLVHKAHNAQTLEALDKLQIEADNLVIDIIHQSEHEEFDETARMSFSFSLDQLRFAIAGRRHAILDQAGAAGSGAKAAAA